MPPLTREFIARLKQETEDYWSDCEIDPRIFGFQFQAGTKWLPGLSQEEIDQYEQRMGFKFPDDVRLLLSEINGTDQPTLNVYGSGGTPHRTGYGVYSYPRDLDEVLLRIQDLNALGKNITDVLKENGIEVPEGINLLPILGHRYVVCGPDPSASEVLSIYGTDAIVYGDDPHHYLMNEFTGGDEPAR